MMYIHFCQTCKRIHILNGHKMFCPRCSSILVELQTSYLDYVSYSPLERTLLAELCQDETHLQELSLPYRMHKYNKWYKALQLQVAKSS